MGDEQRCHPQPPLDIADFRTQILADLGVERAERFVQQQQLRLNGKRAGQGDPLLLSAGQRLRIDITLVFQINHCQQFAAPQAPRRRRRPLHTHSVFHILADGQVGE